MANKARYDERTADRSDSTCVDHGIPTKTADIPKTEVLKQPTRGYRHNQEFENAVMIASIVNALYLEKYPLGKKKVQKCLYLLRRHQNKSTKQFLKKVAGPYSNRVPFYKGGKPIAQNAHYITQEQARTKVQLLLAIKISTKHLTTFHRGTLKTTYAGWLTI